MKTLPRAVITLCILLAGIVPSVYADEEAELRAVTPLPGGYVQFEYDTDSNAQADLFVLYTVLWQGWSDQTDAELQRQSLQDNVGVIAVEPSARVECLSLAPAYKPCKGRRYVYVLQRTPTQTCHRSECQEPQESSPSPP